MARKTSQAIQQEYNQAKFQLGHLEWQLHEIPGLIDTVRSQLKVLDKELTKSLEADQREQREKAEKEKANGVEAKPPTTTETQQAAVQ